MKRKEAEDAEPEKTAKRTKKNVTGKKASKTVNSSVEESDNDPLQEQKAENAGKAGPGEQSVAGPSGGKGEVDRSGIPIPVSSAL